MGDEHEPLPKTRHKTSPPVHKPPATTPARDSGDRALGNDYLARTGKPRATDYGEITMEFDGADLIVRGDGKEIFRFSAQSGRPVTLTDADTKASGADQVTATYMNDKRFVGVTDFGPIPEGTFSLQPSAIEHFSPADQRSMLWDGIWGNKESTINGNPIHTGDWGTGRVALHPVGRLRPGPPGVGDVYKRSGFFLHGGVLAGSSGCIDIGGDFDTVSDFLAGYRKPVTLKVEYHNTPPIPGFFTGVSGAIAYGKHRNRFGPTLGLGVEFTAAGARPVATAEIDYVRQWAGAAFSAGLRLDVPFTDKDAFVRGALTAGVDFRIFRPLYGQLFAGYDVDLGGPGKQGAEVGAGLRVDLNSVQLEAVYNVLRPFADQDDVTKQLMVKLGFRF